MTSKDYKPLPNACVKNLCDKLFEKRKAGAMEVEQQVFNCYDIYDRLVKTYVQKEKNEEIERILQIFGQDFIVSPNVNVRKGGLFGLASVAIGVGQVRNELVYIIYFVVMSTVCRCADCTHFSSSQGQ